MNKFEYYNPVKVIFGAGELDKISSQAKRFGNRVCLVSYKELLALEPLMNRITSQLKSEGIEVCSFYEVEANPEISMIKRGVNLCKERNIELVIGVGGGSAMDAAKVIAAGVYYDGELWDMVNTRHNGNISSVPPTKALPLLMVPTLPATGSEMNQCAVVSNHKLNEKSYIWASCLFPTVSIIDPELTLSLPIQQTAYAAADTISHVFEIYFNGETDSDLQHYFQEGIMRTVIDNIGRILENPNDISARSHLQWAATCAINGWASPGDAWTPIHQIGHVLTSRHKVAHGASLAILMPTWMKLFWDRKPKQYYRFAKNVMQVCVDNKSETEVISEGISRFCEFLKSMGANLTLTDMGITKDDLSSIVDDVVKVSFGDDGKLYCNPIITKSDVNKLLEISL